MPYSPLLEKQYIQGNPQEMYAPHEFQMDSDKQDGYFSHSVKYRVGNHPKNTYQTPLVMMDHPEPQDSSISEYKGTSPTAGVATTYVPFNKANFSNLLPKVVLSQAHLKFACQINRR
jgi:hypothetical protein